MSDGERTGLRDLTFSRWHRAQSTGRYMPLGNARRLKALDLDFIEYCDRCRQPLLLIELAYDNGRSKPTQLLVRLANRAGLAGVLIYWRPTADGSDLASLRICQVAPIATQLQRVTPDQYARGLWNMRVRHGCEHFGLLDDAYEVQL
jgi:hypothetical protein